MVARPVRDAMAQPMINHRGPEFAELLARLERGMRPIFGTSSDVVFLGCSGTGGLEAAVTALFSPGDRVLACPVGVFGYRFAAIAREHGCAVEILETPSGAALDPQALAARLADDDARDFTGVLLTHNETSTGVQNDMRALASVLRGRVVFSVVDSVSGLGAAPFEMDAWGYDVVVSASQKALAVPPGVAMIAVSPRGWAAMAQARGEKYYFDVLKAREFARIGQTPWTPPIAILFALDASLAIFHTAGADASFERHAEYAQRIRTGLEGLGFRIYSRPNAHSVTVVAAEPPRGVDANALVAALREKHDIIISGGQADLAGKIIRIGTMGHLSSRDVERALGVMAVEVRIEEGFRKPRNG